MIDKALHSYLLVIQRSHRKPSFVQIFDFVSELVLLIESSLLVEVGLYHFPPSSNCVFPTCCVLHFLKLPCPFIIASLFNLSDKNNAGPRSVEDQVHWANYSWKCCYFWSFSRSWELNTLWKILLILGVSFSVRINVLFKKNSEVKRRLDIFIKKIICRK